MPSVNNQEIESDSHETTEESEHEESEPDVDYEIKVEEIECDGFQISLRTSATVSLPFILPFIGIRDVQVVSEVGSFGERKITTNYYGINIG